MIDQTCFLQSGIKFGNFDRLMLNPALLKEQNVPIEDNTVAIMHGGYCVLMAILIAWVIWETCSVSIYCLEYEYEWSTFGYEHEYQT